MKPIPYDKFEIDKKILKCLNEHYTVSKIKEYFNRCGVWPESGVTSSFTIPSNLMEEYKKYYYADYLRTRPDYTKIPFTIEVLSDGEISWNLGEKTVQYSKNYGEWLTMDSSTTISVADGDDVRFKGTNENYSGNTFSSTSQFNAVGNIMSLIGGDFFETQDTVGEGCFYDMFKMCSTIISAKDLKLPATNLGKFCYCEMFGFCCNLVAAPDLPATKMAYGCYNAMFSSCSSLKTTPELQSTELDDYCYMGMFFGCSKLESAPELPATRLKDCCYYQMFEWCTNLIVAPILPSTELVGHCYWRMFSQCHNLSYIKAMFKTTPSQYHTWNWVDGVSSSGTFVKNSSAEWDEIGNDGVPSGWTVQYDVLFEEGQWFMMQKTSGSSESGITENVRMFWDSNSGYSRCAMLKYSVHLDLERGGEVDREGGELFFQEGELGDDGSIPNEIYEMLDEWEKPNGDWYYTLDTISLSKEGGSQIFKVEIPNTWSDYDGLDVRQVVGARWSIEIEPITDWSSMTFD